MSALPSTTDIATSNPVKWTSKTFQRWLTLKEVDFVEVFRGHGEATIRVREQGMTAAEGFDKQAMTYEKKWQLDEPQDQAEMAFMIVYILKPWVTHYGTPCTRMGKLAWVNYGGQLDAA